MEEYCPIINIEGDVIGKATRLECHSGSMLLHPVVHLHIIKKGGYVYLQKRSKNKDIQPGKWDTSVGGHVDYGESVEAALLREAFEELAIKLVSPQKVVNYIFCSDIEQEMVYVYFMVVDENFECVYDDNEIEDARFWHIEEINNVMGKGILTPNFEQEFNRIKYLII